MIVLGTLYLYTRYGKDRVDGEACSWSVPDASAAQYPSTRHYTILWYNGWYDCIALYLFMDEYVYDLHEKCISMHLL